MLRKSEKDNQPSNSDSESSEYDENQNYSGTQTNNSASSMLNWYKIEKDASELLKELDVTISGTVLSSDNSAEYTISGSAVYVFDSDKKTELEKEKKSTEGAKTLEEEVLQYLEENSTKMESVEEITNLIKDKELSDAEVAALVLPFKDKGLNYRIKSWVLQHKADEVDMQMIIDVAELYDHGDFVSLSEEQTVSDLASNLFELNEPSLSADVVACLLIGDCSSSDSDVGDAIY